MIKIIVEIPDKIKAKEFIKATKNNYAYIKNIKIITNKEKENKQKKSTEKTLYYTPNQLSYTFEEVKQIATHFPKNKKWTFQDLKNHFPSNLKIKVEIIKNKLKIMASPDITHQRISNNLSFEMTSHAKKNNLGEIMVAPIDVKFDDNNCFQPDIIFIGIDNFDLLEQNSVEGIPDLVGEIWSKGNKKKEKDKKIKIYEEKGVLELWEIYPTQQKITVKILENNQYQIFSEQTKNGIIKSKVLAGFEVDLEKIFPKIK